jgi:outer membrane receptor protein involved in Fe transport
MTIAANVAYLNNRMELPNSDNALFGILGMGLYGYPDPASIAATQGFASDTGFFYGWKTTQNYDRITGSVRGDYHPISWLTFNGNVGIDRYAREDRNRIPRVSAYGSFGSVYTNGFIQNYTYDINDLTTNGSGTAMFDLRPDLVSTTSAGSQFIRENLHRIYAFGAGLTPGVEESLAGATSDYEAGETNTPNATMSAYLQQQFAWRDRVFLNAALRADKNTAFGQNIGWISYPSFSGSWVVSDESFFPKLDALNQLRLRAAYGQAGLRPGPTDALLSFTGQTSTFTRNDVAGITFNTALGNADLRPERSSEWELGFESQFLGNRLGAEVTYYNKVSKDALVNVPLAPSLGSGSTQFQNLGRVDNKGFEYRLNATPVRSNNFEWNASINGSTTDNKLVTLGRYANGQPVAPIITGFISTQRHVEGFPLGGYWQSPITTYADANADGLLSPSEVTVRRDTSVYLGNPFPKRELSFSTDFRFRDWARISGLIDYKGGQKLLNFTKAFRCSSNDTFNCPELYDPSTPLDLQAAMVASSFYSSYAGFVENASFAKLREIAVTFMVPARYATRAGVQGLSVTLAGRNLHTWTNYSGLDPEVNFNGQVGFTTGDAATLPPTRLFQIRLDANF